MRSVHQSPTARASEQLNWVRSVFAGIWFHYKTNGQALSLQPPASADANDEGEVLESFVTKTCDKAAVRIGEAGGL